MHKKIKYIIAASLVIGVVSGVLPTNNFILGAVEVYASTYKSASDGELESLTLYRTENNAIPLKDSYYGDEVSVSEQKDYYVDLTGADGFDLSADVKGSGYVVKEFNSGSSTEQGNDISKFVRVDSTYADIYLRTYKSENAYETAYSNGDVTDCEKTYILHVKKPVVNSDEELDADYANLKSIYLSDGSIDFSKDKTSYDVNVKDNVQEMLIKATPDDDDDVVTLNDSALEEDNDYGKTIKLNEGTNTVKIVVKSNDDDKTYTLNIYRGNVAASTTATNQTSQNTTGVQNFAIQNGSNTGKFNSWQRSNGKWQYIDGTGQPLKNKWWFDKNDGKNYHLDADGYRNTGWFSDDNKWYYSNENGEMQTGWISLNKNWYYLNKGGVMQMGWLEDSAGNWYYLDNNGAMQTGWVENSDGSWYYMDSTGKMITDSVVNGYSIDKNGILV